MNTINKKDNIILTFRKNEKTKRGFTLVETMVAVFILTLIIISLMTVVANSLFSSRYSRNEITANYLLQEVADYVRNDRDTTVFLQNGETEVPWQEFVNKYNFCLYVDKKSGCYLNVFDTINSLGEIKQCITNFSDQEPTGCPYLYYDSNAENSAFYTYDENNTVQTIFQRKIYFKEINVNEVMFVITVYWKSGSVTKSKSLNIHLTRWLQ